MMTLEHEEELLRHLAFMVSYQAQMTATLKTIAEKLASIDGSLEAMYVHKVN